MQLCAFEQHLDDYVGAPRVAGFGFSALDGEVPPLAVVKDFDMDCPVLAQKDVHPRFSSLFPNGSSSCLMSVYWGKLRAQYA